MSAAERKTMLLTTPFHSRVEQYCELNDWGAWQGYTTPNSYFDVELEYFAIRSTAGVLDLSPMNKYRISGPDAEAFLSIALSHGMSARLVLIGSAMQSGVMTLVSSWTMEPFSIWPRTITGSAPTCALTSGSSGTH